MLHGSLRFLACLLATTLLSALLIMPSAAVYPAISAECACLYLPQTDTFIYQKNADRRHPMASTTKIVTALAVLSTCSLADTVTVAPEAVGVEGSSVYLKAGEQFRVEDLLYALLLASANDAAAALAIHVSGSVEGFADLMNETAASLSLTDTHFTNPHGLYDEEHYTTAADLARISAAAMENEDFARIVSTKSKVITSLDGETVRTLQNHNKLLRLYKDATGIKTGFTKKSGRCLVSAAERNGLRLIAVTLDAPDDWRDHTALLDLGFSLYRGYIAADEDIRYEIPVVGGETESISLSPKTPVTLVLPKEAPEPVLTVEINRFAVAPIRAGQVLGMAYYTVNGKTVAKIPLLADGDVPAAVQKNSLLDKIKHFFNL